jgi:hypothetical protein
MKIITDQKLQQLIDEAHSKGSNEASQKMQHQLQEEYLRGRNEASTEPKREMPTHDHTQEVPPPVRITNLDLNFVFDYTNSNLNIFSIIRVNVDKCDEHTVVSFFTQDNLNEVKSYGIPCRRVDHNNLVECWLEHSKKINGIVDGVESLDTDPVFSEDAELEVTQEEVKPKRSRKKTKKQEKVAVNND